METLQGFDRAEIVKRPYSEGQPAGTELEALATYVAYKSNGLKFAPRLEHAKEKEALALGETLFFRRQGPMDFACATCHADAGRRIRLQGLPYPRQARGGAHGGRRVAGLSRLAGHRHDHAAPHRRLLLADAPAAASTTART